MSGIFGGELEGEEETSIFGDGFLMLPQRSMLLWALLLRWRHHRNLLDQITKKIYSLKNVCRLAVEHHSNKCGLTTKKPAYFSIIQAFLSVAVTTPRARRSNLGHCVGATHLRERLTDLLKDLKCLWSAYLFAKPQISYSNTETVNGIPMSLR